jgi:hypothetical protein
MNASYLETFNNDGEPVYVQVTGSGFPLERTKIEDVGNDWKIGPEAARMAKIWPDA